MKGLAALCTLLLVLATGLVAQERRATLMLDDGRRLTGIVVTIDLESVQLRVDGEILHLPAASVRSFRFDDGEAAAEIDEAAAEPPAAMPPKPRISWRRPLPDPVDPDSRAAVPHDLRHGSLWRKRLVALDEAYPWLVPVAPSQWCSLGLLLIVGLGLAVFLSVRVAGAEAATLGLSVVLGLWYLVTGFLQMALVPVNDLTFVVMVIGNASCALFWICTLFGLTRSAASIAFAVQLGFALVVYGVLELVTSLLASVGVAS